MCESLDWFFPSLIRPESIFSTKKKKTGFCRLSHSLFTEPILLYRLITLLHTCLLCRPLRVSIQVQIIKGPSLFFFLFLPFRSHSRHKITDIIDVSSINLLFSLLSRNAQTWSSANVKKCVKVLEFEIKRGLGFLLCIPTHLTHTLFSQPFFLPLPTLYSYSHSYQQHTLI